uniref:Uncharacterized protein n=1 Tax=Plectus sambesii TaxID=2011161 RepID=A0A914XK60_9BILA
MRDDDWRRKGLPHRVTQGGTRPLSRNNCQTTRQAPPETDGTARAAPTAVVSCPVGRTFRRRARRAPPAPTRTRRARDLMTNRRPTDQCQQPPPTHRRRLSYSRQKSHRRLPPSSHSLPHGNRPCSGATSRP